MYPRKQLDITVMEILYGILQCINPFLDKAKIINKIEALWATDSRVLPTLSVRSGFDLLFSVLSLPEDSEVIMTGITIPDMGKIVIKHKLKIVPIDLNLRSLSFDIDELLKKITSKTKMIVIAHLYGAVMDLKKIEIIKERYPDLLIIEDCAQAFSGLEGYKGYPASDILMYSFGTIKTCTALGGGLLVIKNQALFDKMNEMHGAWPVSSSTAYLKKLTKTMLLKLVLSYRGLDIFIFICKLFRKDWDEVIIKQARGFQGSDLFSQIRKQPSKPLLAMLFRKLKYFNKAYFQKRVEKFNQVRNKIDSATFLHGIDNASHTNWLFPLTANNPSKLITALQNIGIDATKRSTQLTVLEPTDKSIAGAEKCKNAMQSILYIPILPTMEKEILEKIIVLVNSDTCSLQDN